MLHIWQHGPATVHDVHDALNVQVGAKQLAYTTVLTVLRNLFKRKFLDRKAEGRHHRFAPLISEETYKLAMVRQMREELFGGDAGQMLGCIARDDGINEITRGLLQELAIRD
jgi:predicted transcriptional regulator